MQFFLMLTLLRSREFPQEIRETESQTAFYKNALTLPR